MHSIHHFENIKMREKLFFPKEKGYKNKLIAQEFGIIVAQEYFEDNLDPENQSLLFSWEKTDNFRIQSLWMHFRNQPKNIDELFSIAQESAKIEFSNLKEKHGKNLPLKEINDEFAISAATHICTTGFFMVHQNRVFKQIENESGLEIARQTFKNRYLKMFSIKDLKKLSIEKFTRISDAKKFNTDIQKNVLNNIDHYWSAFKSLEHEIYELKPA